MKNKLIARKEFETFQKEFKKWQYRFGCTGYKVYFHHKPIEGAYASITIQQSDMAANVIWNSASSEDSEPCKDIKGSAKHEAIHLLLGRLVQNARYRYLAESEVYEAVEELTVKLEGLIGNNIKGGK